MKISAAIICLLMACFFIGLYADTWVGVWGYTWKETTGVDFEGVNVQAKSIYGDSPIVQSYYKDGDTQYDLDAPTQIEYDREYYRVDGWKGFFQGTANGFTWTTGSIERTIILHSIGK